MSVVHCSDDVRRMSNVLKLEEASRALAPSKIFGQARSRCPNTSSFQETRFLGMLATPWICRSCLSRLARPAVRRRIRSYAIQAKTAPNSVPPALLDRAHNFADEHRQLISQLSQGFDARAAKQIGVITPIVNALQRWKKAEEVRQWGSQCWMHNC
jgi:hypothetical protein